MKRPQHVERRVAVEDGELVYQVFGEGPPILFLNGLGASWNGFHSQIAHLSNRYRCVVWEYRGLYADPDSRARQRTTLSIADHARDALAILEHEGDDSAALVGWSIGVQVALQLFTAAPSRVALMLLVCGGARAPWGNANEAGVLQRFFPSVLGLLERMPRLVSMIVQAGGRSPETLAWARRIRLVGGDADADQLADVARSVARVDVSALFETLRGMARDDLSFALSAVDVPTLVIGGDRDPFTPRAALERLVHQISGAEYLLLAGASHYLLLDHAEHVNLRIDKFFAERGYSGRPSMPSLHPR